MSEEKTYTIEAAHHFFGIDFNGKIWNLLDKQDKNQDELDEMVNLAHASLLHWKKNPKCKKVNIQRGEYMIALAYISANRKEQALYHAKKCFKLTEDFKNEMEDFLRGILTDKELTEVPNRLEIIKLLKK